MLPLFGLAVAVLSGRRPSPIPMGSNGRWRPATSPTGKRCALAAPTSRRWRLAATTPSLAPRLSGRASGRRRRFGECNELALALSPPRSAISRHQQGEASSTRRVAPGRAPRLLPLDGDVAYPVAVGRRRRRHGIPLPMHAAGLSPRPRREPRLRRDASRADRPDRGQRVIAALMPRIRRRRSRARRCELTLDDIGGAAFRSDLAPSTTKPSTRGCSAHDRLAHGPLRVGIGGPVGSGKTALMEALCKRLRERYDICAITNDIYTKEDARLLTRRGRAAGGAHHGRRDRRLPAHRDPRGCLDQPRRHRRPCARAFPTSTSCSSNPAATIWRRRSRPSSPT